MAMPVKAFILAGQSNMVGHGAVAMDPGHNEGKGSLEYAAKDPANKKVFGKLLGKDGRWVVRDDVWIEYFERKGKLTVGFGANMDRIGPELGFGMVVGDAVREPVLLIKIAWGGRSLASDFRPPSSGGTVGPSYKELIRLAKESLSQVGSRFPEFAGRPVQLAGFGWHQGWNDRINAGYVAEYEQNMANFIRDVRKDLNAPLMPFAIAETGMGGMQEKSATALALMKAQADVALHPEFRSNVAFVGTRTFWREKELSPSDQGYHWNTSGETYYLIGDAMGHAMVGLMKRGRK